MFQEQEIHIQSLVQRLKQAGNFIDENPRVAEFSKKLIIRKWDVDYDLGKSVRRLRAAAGGYRSVKAVGGTVFATGRDGDYWAIATVFEEFFVAAVAGEGKTGPGIGGVFEDGFLWECLAV